MNRAYVLYGIYVLYGLSAFGEPVMLFDEKSFAGWEGNLAMFHIQDGAIVAGTLDARIPRNEFLCTTREYGDFDLRLKVKLLGESANAGIQFRTKRIPNHHEVSGYQADMGQIFWGCLYDESRRNKVLAQADQDKMKEIVKPGDWNDYRIRAEGPHIQLWLNGVQTVDYTETDDTIPRTGIIGVQIHVGGPSEAWYKDIIIEELNGGTEAAASASELPAWLAGNTLEATWTGGVGLIVEHRCVHCHRKGEVAPMVFTGYDDVRTWAKKAYTPLDALIRTRAMPPWPADPSVGHFKNAELLTQPETDLLLTWIKSGFPRGDGEFAFATKRVEGWSIGEPDHVFELPEYAVPKDIEGEYKEFTIQTEFSDDRWIAAAEARPGESTIVMAIDAGPLGQYRPGNTARLYHDPSAQLLKRGESVPVRVHYLKAAGYSPVDKSRLGVVFVKQRTNLDVTDDPMAAEPFTIPAGKADFTVTTSIAIPPGSQIMSLMPIMRQRGKSVTYSLDLPGGEAQTLLTIPAWDPRWQYRYEFTQPFAVPSGGTLTATAIFDNSEDNIKNPDPDVEVKAGPTGEIFEGWVAYRASDQPQ